MRVACILVDHLPFKLEVQRDPLMQRKQVIIIQRRCSRRTVLDVSPGIRHVTPGMPLQEAIACCKDAALVEADLPWYNQVWDKALLRLGNRSPIVEPAGLGYAYIGLDGLQDYYGSEERLVNALIQAVPLYLEPRLGISHGKFPAYLAVLRAEPGRAYKPPFEVKQFLASFPIEVLPVSWDVKKRLRSFGLDTLGKIAGLPVGPLQAQFGPVGAKIWHLVQGQDDTPLVSQRPEEEIAASTAFDVPTTSIEPLLMVVDNLLARLFAQPEIRGRYARTALLEGQILNRPTWQRRVVFKTPVGDRNRAYFAIKSALEGITLPGPLEEVRLTFKGLTGEVGRQESLFQDVRRREQLHQTIAQLKASQGCNPIYQVREVEPWSRIPERRRALVTFEP